MSTMSSMCFLCIIYIVKRLSDSVSQAWICRAHWRGFALPIPCELLPYPSAVRRPARRVDHFLRRCLQSESREHDHQGQTYGTIPEQGRHQCSVRRSEYGDGSDRSDSDGACLSGTQTDSICQNHDLDFGVAQFRHLSDQCRFPWLLANVLDPALGDDVPIADCSRTCMLTSSNGLKVGVIGLGEREWLNSLTVCFASRNAPYAHCRTGSARSTLFLRI